MLLMHVPQLGSAKWQMLSTITSVGVSALLAFGVLTPLASLAGFIVGAACLATGQHDIAADLTLMMLTLSLAMIGAGAYSIDAKLYGRREIRVTRQPATPPD